MMKKILSPYDKKFIKVPYILSPFVHVLFCQISFSILLFYVVFQLQKNVLTMYLVCYLKNLHIMLCRAKWDFYLFFLWVSIFEMRRTYRTGNQKILCLVFEEEDSFDIILPTPIYVELLNLAMLTMSTMVSYWLISYHFLRVCLECRNNSCNGIIIYV